MGVPEILRTSTFRWASVASGAFAVFVLALFGFIYWKADRYLVARSDHVISSQLDVLSALPFARQVDAIEYQLAEDPRGVQFAGLFRPDGGRIAGNLARPPVALKLDAIAQSVEPVKAGAGEGQTRRVRAIGRQLPDGDVLVIGRNVDEAMELATVVSQALALDRKSVV